MAKNRGNRRRSGRGATTGRPVAGPPADIAPDELVFGNAAQLRRMAETLRRGDTAARTRAVGASAARIRTFQQTHRTPDAELSTLVGRPFCDTAGADAAGGDHPVPPGRVFVTAAADDGPVDLWVEGYITGMAWFDDEISAANVRAILDDADGRDVRVHMNSPGGDYFEGIAIYRTLSDYPGGVYVAIDALAASAASVVAMAGDRIGIGDGAFIMIHQASAFAYGNAEDLMATAAMLDVIDTEMTGFYARRGNDGVDWAAAVRAETWYGPDKAIEAGLADERLTGSAASSADPEIAALFEFAKPAAAGSDKPPAGAGRVPVGEPGPDPDDTADWASLFALTPEDLFS